MLVLNLRDLWEKISLEEEGLDLRGHSAAGMVSDPNISCHNSSLLLADIAHNAKVEYSRGTSEYDLYPPPKMKYK